MHFIESYKFKNDNWNPTEIRILIYMVREFKPENHRLFAQMLSMLEPTSRKKIFDEIVNIGEHFKRIGDIAKIEDEKNKLFEGTKEKKGFFNLLKVKRKEKEYWDKVRERLEDKIYHLVFRGKFFECKKVGSLIYFTRSNLIK